MIGSPFSVLRVLVLALAAAIAWGTWGEIRVSRGKAAYAEAVAQLERDRAQVADAAHAAEAKARAQEARIHQAHTEALNAAHAQALAIARDRDRAASAARSLRDQLAAIRDRAGQAGADPGTASDRAAASATITVLADLLSRCSERRDELARFADESRLAGQACERSYDALKIPSNTAASP